MMAEHKKKSITPARINLYKAYITLLTIMYIYIYHISDKYGDILADIKIDILGKFKCSMAYDGCETQILDGYGLFRMFIFFGFGYVNPHSHIHIGILSILIQIYSILLGSKKNLLLTPIINMIGYSLGSATCTGCA